jgi:hypothetical protein
MMKEKIGPKDDGEREIDYCIGDINFNCHL